VLLLMGMEWDCAKGELGVGEQGKGAQGCGQTEGVEATTGIVLPPPSFLNAI
jgi:hypothetical protein